MSDQNQKRDAGKTRYDLVPWGEVQITGDDYRVQDVFDSLKMWWTGRPYRLQVAVPKRQLPYLAKVLTFGAAKYSPRGWEAGIPFSRVFAAAARHASAHLAGEYLDEETGLPHESHLWCNVLFLLVFTARGRTDLDDRPEASAETKTALDRMQALVAQLSGEFPAGDGAGLASGSGGKGAN